MARPDLLALGDDSLASLANRGIVNRALREVGDGRGPAVEEAGDGTVTAAFADGTTVVLPPSATLEQARCSCPASGVCRHRVMAVVAYRRQAESAPWTAWSPAGFTDDDLENLLGSRTMAAARKALRTGYRARVRRAGPADPVPTVELPSCAVRFLVPHELGYARVDAARGARDDAIALAVWAFRRADEVDPQAGVLDVAVGGAAAGGGARAGPGLDEALPLLGDLLADGVVHTGPGAATAAVQVRRALDARNLRWPVDALDDLAGQIEAYRARSARYHANQAAELVAEVVGRHRCVAGGGASLRPDVLGTEEAPETPLRLLRLTGLGARVTGSGPTRTVEVYLAHAEAGIVLTLRRNLDLGEDEAVPAADIGRRKAAGVRLSALAAGNVVTESAARSANRVVRIAESRVGRTTVTPSVGAWDGLPPAILLDDLEAEAARLAGLAPFLVRPRVVAESVRAIAVEELEAVHYLPGAQRLLAPVRARRGRAVVVRSHSAATEGAVDALAEALGGQLGPVRFVAGHLRRHGGELLVEPTAVVAGATVVVPDFAPARGAALAPGSLAPSDPLAAAVAAALDLSAEVVHRGWRHLPPGWAGRVERSAEALRRTGLTRTADAVAALVPAVRGAGGGAGAGGPEAGEAVLAAWADTHLRLLVTAEQL